MKKNNTGLRQRLHEWVQVQLKRLKKRWELFIERGHSRMTVMLIPHNEKKIFNFQISKFTFSFFVMLFIIIIGSSSFAYIKNNAIKREQQQLLLTYNDIRSHLYQFDQMTSDLNRLVGDIKPEIEEIYRLSSGSDIHADQIWGGIELDDDNSEELNEMKNILPEGVFTLKNIQHDVVAATNTIKTVKNFIDVRSRVVKETPSIIPNRGHITSLFGWRRSPFGHGRDFHTGIDIAAPGGTPIRATAPGEVVSSGWSGGYGNMIRIRHKYGFETIHAHCQSIRVSPGTRVSRGQIIGYVGQTGNATGNHNHYEIRLGGVPINPYPYMSRIW